jgi:TonB family protein
MLSPKTARLLTASGTVLLAGLFLAASAQTDNKKIDCDKPVLTPASSAPAMDFDFSLGSNANAEFAKQELVGKPASGLAIYAIVPRDGCELRNIFRRTEGPDKRNATPEDLGRIYSSLQPLTDLGVTLTADTRSDRGFASFIKHTDAGYIAILGHSEDGVFRFPDGSQSTLTAMARECADNNKRCLFTACLLSEAPSVGLYIAKADSILINKDALNALRAIQGYIEQEPGGISLGQLVLKPIKGHEQDTGVNYAMHYIVDPSRKAQVIGAVLSLGLIKIPDDVGRGIAAHVGTIPVPLNNPRPNYTEAARNHKVQGTVRVRALVGADGLVKRVIVISGLPDGLNEEAIRAVYQVKFRPATKGGLPVAFWEPIDVDFDLGYGQRPH